MFRKALFPLIAAAALLVSCHPAGKVLADRTPSKVAVEPLPDDSTEYELLIFDPGFESWFVKNRKPEWYYTNDYLAHWNFLYVVAWNQRVRDPITYHYGADSPFITEIDYRPNIDYGLDLNYKLYHYFRYVEETWGRILFYDRRI